MTGLADAISTPSGPGIVQDGASVTTIRVRQTLGAPPPVVWAELEHLEAHPQWMHDAVAIRFLTERRRGVGTRYECDTKVGPIRMTDVMEITEWSPGRAMGVRHVGLVTGSGRFTLRKQRGGRTRFTWTEQLDFPWRRGGPVVAHLAKPVLKRIWKKNLRALATRFPRP